MEEERGLKGRAYGGNEGGGVAVQGRCVSFVIGDVGGERVREEEEWKREDGGYSGREGISMRERRKGVEAGGRGGQERRRRWVETETEEVGHEKR